MTVNACTTIEIFRRCYYYTSHLIKLSKEYIKIFNLMKINFVPSSANAIWIKMVARARLTHIDHFKVFASLRRAILDWNKWWKCCFNDIFSEPPAGWCNQFNPATVRKLLLQWYSTGLWRMKLLCKIQIIPFEFQN